MPARKPAIDAPQDRTLLAPPVKALVIKADIKPEPKPQPEPAMLKGGDGFSNREASLYSRIFAAQAKGDFVGADELIRDLGDKRLMGHVLYQRYMHPDYKAVFVQLQDWLQRYSDHPGADRIYRLADSRRPAGYKGPLKQASSKSAKTTGQLTILSAGGKTYTPDSNRSADQRRQVAELKRLVSDDIRDGSPTRALKRLSHDKTAKWMDEVEYDQLRGQIANGYLLMGKTMDARRLAEASVRRSGAHAPMAGWAGGLAAWKQKDYKQAAGFFEKSAESPYVNSWQKSASAYWASRAHMRAGNPEKVSHWLKEAAHHPRTFYGLLATRALGWDFDFNWDRPDFTQAQSRQLESIPAAARAMALVQAGQNHLAEYELATLDTDNDPVLKETVLTYAQTVNLPGVAMRLASTLARDDGSLYDAALYPMLPWTPEGGYAVDRALIHAIIRQESRFVATAESNRGASGLMQVMPATAVYVAGKQNMDDVEIGRARLKDPAMNLDIGQKYVTYLLKQREVGNDLLSMAIAYNAGPGNLRKWKGELVDARHDPLLFIETIPMAETRNYVERVLANYWIYGLRMNHPLPTLDALAEGRWAKYVPLDDAAGTTVRLSDSGRSVFKLAAN